MQLTVHTAEHVSTIPLGWQNKLLVELGKPKLADLVRRLNAKSGLNRRKQPSGWVLIVSDDVIETTVTQQRFQSVNQQKRRTQCAAMGWWHFDGAGLRLTCGFCKKHQPKRR
jgi:hypothetical protein